MGLTTCIFRIICIPKLDRFPIGIAAPDLWSCLMTEISEVISLSSNAVSLIDSGLKLFKSIKDNIGKNDNESLQKTREMMINMYDQLLDTREKNQQLRAALIDLQEKISAKSEWASNLDKYELEEGIQNSIMHKLKSPSSEAERSMRFCANCFNRHSISILHVDSAQTGYDKMSCPNCSSKALVKNDRRPKTVRAVRYNPLRRGSLDN